MIYYELPHWLRITAAFLNVLSIPFAMATFQMMSYRWHEEYQHHWFYYFTGNIIAVVFFAALLFIVEMQIYLGQPLSVTNDINWILLFILIGHLSMFLTRILDHRYNFSTFLLLLRILLLILLLPIPGQFFWGGYGFTIIFSLHNLIWFFGFLYYTWITYRYLNYNLTDYSKIKAFELSPHGIIIADSANHIININPKASEILQHLGPSRPKLHELPAHFFTPNELLHSTDHRTYRIYRNSFFVQTKPYVSYEMVDITELERIDREIETNLVTLAASNRELEKMIQTIQDTIEIEEANNMSKHVHDVLGQQLSVIIMSLQSMSRGQYSQVQLEGLKKMARNLFLSLEQRSIFVNQDFNQSLISSFALAGVNITVEGNMPRSYRLRNIIFQVLREASTNAVRHGGANQIWMVVDHDDKETSFTIKNNGIHVSPDFKEGMGLRGMKELVSSHGGRIEFLQDNQFTIKTVIPIR